MKRKTKVAARRGRRSVAALKEEARMRNVAEMWSAIAALRARYSVLETAVAQIHARMSREG